MAHLLAEQVYSDCVWLTVMRCIISYFFHSVTGAEYDMRLCFHHVCLKDVCVCVCMTAYVGLACQTFHIRRHGLQQPIAVTVATVANSRESHLVPSG